MTWNLDFEPAGAHIWRAVSVRLLAATNFREEDPTMKFVATILGLAAAANAIELTPDNWDTETAGKTVLIKYLAPW